MTIKKLRPFFPPLAHLQSVNLRAALFRALTELKRNGVLGRETMLRKTMLDDCRGDKFEEILAKFALTVLRKCGKEHVQPDIARIIDERDRCRDQETLLPLIIAHQKGLKGVIATKDKERQKFAEIERVFDKEAKALDLANGEPKARRQSSTEGIRKRAEEAKQKLEQAWIGDEAWVDVLVNGGGESSKQVLSTKTFDQFWDSTQPQTLVSTDSKNSRSLLDDLNDRILEQERRLEGWRTFRDELGHKTLEEEKTPIPSAISKPGKSFLINHQALTLDPQNTQKITTTTLATPQNPYGDIIERMQSSLAALREAGTESSAKHDKVAKRETSPARSTEKRTLESRFHKNREKARHGQSVVDFGAEQGNFSPTRRPSKISAASEDKEISLPSDRRQSRLSENLSKSNGEAAQEVPPPRKQQPQDPHLRGSGYSPVRALSPLAEDSLLDPDSPPTPPQPQPSRRTTIPVSNLIERTRQSMSLLPSHNHQQHSKQPHKQTRRSNAARPSQTFPTNQFESPPPLPAPLLDGGKSLGVAQSPRSGSSTPRDSLFSDDAEYASVFKSRPRVAVSPELSPELAMSGRRLGWDGLDEVDETEDLDSSPTRRRG